MRRLGRIIFFPKICGLRKLGQKTHQKNRKKCKNGPNLKVFRFSPKPDKMKVGSVPVEKLRRLGRIIFFPKICGLRKLGQKTDRKKQKKVQKWSKFEGLQIFPET